MTVLIAVLLLYVLTGSGNEDTQIDYLVKMNEETQQYEMSMTIKPNKFLFLDLYMNKARTKNGDLRITNFKAFRDEKEVLHWKTVPGSSSLERLWIGFNKDPITVTYTVNPQVEFGNRGKMLGYLTESYGYIRGMYILYEPINIKDVISWLKDKKQPEHETGVGRVQFDFPEGWEVNDPWVNNTEGVPIGDLANTYWAMGQALDVIKVEKMSTGVVKEKDNYEAQATFEDIKIIYQEIERLTGFKPHQMASYWTINILPPVPIHGGASGSYSVLSQNDISFISHEIFHWWNGFTLKTNGETQWLKEGFTEYYESKVLKNIGIWSEAEFQSCMEKTKAELFEENNPKPINLVGVSKKYGTNNTMEEYHQIYNGGALLAFYIDRELEKNQRSLDEIWLGLYELDKTIGCEDFLNIIEELTDEAFRLEIEDMVNGRLVIPMK